MILTPVQWHHITYTLMPMASCDAYSDANHMKKSYAPPHLSCLYLRNSVVPYIILWDYVTLMPLPIPANNQEFMSHLIYIFFT